MLLRMLSVLALIPGVLSAEEWTPVTEDAAIVDALGGRTVRYDVLTFQFFDASGSTQFITERASDGRWRRAAGSIAAYGHHQTSGPVMIFRSKVIRCALSVPIKA